MGKTFTVQNIRSLTKVVVTSGVAIPLATVSTMVRSLLVMAKRASADNTGNVFIGASDLKAGVNEHIELAPGDYWEYPIPDGEAIDLADLYVDALTALDGITGLYKPALG